MTANKKMTDDYTEMMNYRNTKIFRIVNESVKESIFYNLMLHLAEMDIEVQLIPFMKQRRIRVAVVGNPTTTDVKF